MPSATWRSPRPTPHATADPARAFRHLVGLFVLLGLTVASWLSRLPGVRLALDLSAAELGAVLLAGAVASLLTVLAAGGLVARHGSHRVLLTAAGVFSAATLLLGLAPSTGSVPVLVVGVVLLSASLALGNVPLNLETVVVERALGRTVVPQFHAAFSIGSVLGSGLGAAAAWLQVPLLAQLGAMSVLSLLWRLWSVPLAVLPVRSAGADEPRAAAVGSGVVRPARRGRTGSALSAWREPRTLLLGLLVMTAALSEGSANNWLAISVVESFGRSEAVAAMVFGVFVAAMTTSRLAGSWTVDRFGPVVVVGASCGVSFAGLVLYGTAATLPVAVVGVAAWGLGAGLVVPVGMAAVGHDALRAAGRVAVVSAFASVAGLAAPPVLGLVAESVGVRRALLLVAVALALSLLLARRVAPPSTGDVPEAGGTTRASAVAEVAPGAVDGGIGQRPRPEPTGTHHRPPVLEVAR